MLAANRPRADGVAYQEQSLSPSDRVATELEDEEAARTIPA
jgi:hypothetical protein